MKSHLAALVGALLLGAPSAALAQVGSKGAVKVGVLLPLTGNTAWAGKTNRIAAAIAAEEVNAQDLAGGYRIELVERFLGSNHIRRLGEFTGPGMDDRMAVHVVDAGHDALLQLVF
jgi:hypothetical protein